ncbi:hypothetical protein SNARM312S_02868 [Streptomyces narbonensis]
MSKLRVTLPGARTRWSYGSVMNSPEIVRTTTAFAAVSTPTAPPGTIRVRCRSLRRNDSATDWGVSTPEATWGSSGRYSW